MNRRFVSGLSALSESYRNGEFEHWKALTSYILQLDGCPAGGYSGLYDILVFPIWTVTDVLIFYGPVLVFRPFVLSGTQILWKNQANSANSALTNDRLLGNYEILLQKLKLKSVRGRWHNSTCSARQLKICHVGLKTHLLKWEDLEPVRQRYLPIRR